MKTLVICSVWYDADSIATFIRYLPLIGFVPFNQPDVSLQYVGYICCN